jgi:hypothetical protein
MDSLSMTLREKFLIKVLYLSVSWETKGSRCDGEAASGSIRLLAGRKAVEAVPCEHGFLIPRDRLLV